MIADRVQPPAAAYRVLEDLLVPEWFLKPQPEAGVQLTIVGNDGVQTVWFFSEWQAAQVRDALMRRPTEARIVGSVAYDTRKSR